MRLKWSEAPVHATLVTHRAEAVADPAAPVDLLPLFSATRQQSRGRETIASVVKTPRGHWRFLRR